MLEAQGIRCHKVREELLLLEAQLCPSEGLLERLVALGLNEAVPQTYWQDLAEIVQLRGLSITSDQAGQLRGLLGCLFRDPEAATGDCDAVEGQRRGLSPSLHSGVPEIKSSRGGCRSRFPASSDIVSMLRTTTSVRTGGALVVSELQV